MNSKKKPSKLIIGIISLTIGFAALIASIAFFIIDLNSKPDIRDAEFLVQKGTWVMQSNTTTTESIDCISSEEGSEPTDCATVVESIEPNANNVIWKFTEIGKGVLTTNNHIDDHNFLWALDGDKLLIEVEWLQDLYNEVTYSLDQKNETLELSDAAGHKAILKPFTEPEIKQESEETSAEEVIE